MHNIDITKYIQKNIINIIQEKYPEGKYLYKSCDKYLVILEPTKYTITNQKQIPNDDPKKKYTEFKANELKVIDIIDKFNITKTINNIDIDIDNKSYYEKEVKLIKERIIYPNRIDSNGYGIFFFVSLELAYYYNIINNNNYTGLFKSWHKNGQQEYEGEYLDGKKNGHWIKQYENGQKAYVCDYLDGKLTGHYIEWYSNGQTKYKGEYINGNKTGHWIEYYDNQKKENDGEYLNGNKIGHWNGWYSNGQTKYKGEYINGNKTGHWIEWYDNEQIKEENNYMNGKKIGHCISWYKNGQKESEGEFLDGEQIEYYEWYENGQKKLEEKIVDEKNVDGKFIRHTIKWWKDQIISEGYYLNGKMTGEWNEFYDNKQRKYKGEYLDGKKTGHWINYYPNGFKENEGEYLNDEKTGYWIYWENTGKKEKEGRYLYGEKIGMWINYYYSGYGGYTKYHYSIKEIIQKVLYNNLVIPLKDKFIIYK